LKREAITYLGAIKLSVQRFVGPAYPVLKNQARLPGGFCKSAYGKGTHLKLMLAPSENTACLSSTMLLAAFSFARMCLD
jgi:hypothetical protein